MGKYGLLGEKLSHSFSKQIHEKLGQYTYYLMPMPVEELHIFLRKREFNGVNVTIPYKQEVIPFCDYVDEAAKRIGAVNTIINIDGMLHGYNTDFYGLKYTLEKGGVVVYGKDAYILGSGGTAKTATAVLRHLNAERITVVSRSADTPCSFADRTMTYEEAESLGEAEVIINTTPIGMYPRCDAVPIDITLFPFLEAVVDVIYNPLETKLIYQTKQYATQTGRRIVAVNGLLMLVAQAIFASEYFMQGEYMIHGEPLDPEKSSGTIDRIYSEMCRSMRNLVVVGMPSAGKTSLGKAVSKLLTRRFVDIDYQIEQKAGQTITEIFSKHGEPYFRKLEREVIAAVSEQNGIVIATGGGALLDPENVCKLHSNGRIIFIDRPLEKLATGGSRPLSTDAEALRVMYEKRYPIYLAASDAVVQNDGAFGTAAEKVKESFYETASI